MGGGKKGRKKLNKQTKEILISKENSLTNKQTKEILISKENSLTNKQTKNRLKRKENRCFFRFLEFGVISFEYRERKKEEIPLKQVENC